MAKAQNKWLPFSDEERAKIKKKNNPMLNLFLQTGIRRFELYELLEAPLQGDGWKIVGKRDTFRIVPFHPLININLELVRSFWNAKSLTYVNTYFNNLAMELGITKEVLNEETGKMETKPDMNPHRFRSTFGTELANNGIDLVTIQTLMGHKDLSQTAQYIKINTKKLKNATKYIIDPKYSLEGMTESELQEEIVRLRLRLDRFAHEE